MSNPELTASSLQVGNSEHKCIYFAIHKHMHQPYYDAVNVEYWDGEKQAIFAQRHGAYSQFIPDAVWQYIKGGLAHAAMSTSWSGSLIEQLDRCEAQGRGFENWANSLRALAQERTVLGYARVNFTAFGHFHPLMPLIPHRDIIGQINWHKEIIYKKFGQPASKILFPPETAFQGHMIPALNQAGIEAVIYDSIHHFRACQDYPYAGIAEGQLPPNPADQINPPAQNWLQLNNIWAPSKISPKLLKPCFLVYTDNLGQEHQIIGIPAERYLGNEDARGGYGALQYEQVMGQIYENLIATDNYDPKHPPFFVLHSDGDNYGGGADSYYRHNTAGLVKMCQQDARFQLIGIEDYLHLFPVDPNNKVHVEAGAWAGADNGDPQFSKWFSMAELDYSPDLNSWAILTAAQNLVHSLEDSAMLTADKLQQLQRLLYTAETSCYWYWTGQANWDMQVTRAANKIWELTLKERSALQTNKQDLTAPTIFMPWVRPANPGGLTWGQGQLIAAVEDATFRTFVADISEVKAVILHCINADGSVNSVDMQDLGPYPSRTQPASIAHQYVAIVSAQQNGSGKIRYFIEAIDARGNTAYSPTAQIYLD
jgi:hypothetical protein